MIRKLTAALAALLLAAAPVLAQSPTGSWQVDAYPVDAAGHPAATTVKVPFSGVPIAPAQIPAPTASTLGGVKSSTAPTNNFQTGIDTAGAPTYARPAAGNVSGLAAIAASGSASDLVSGTVPAGQLGNAFVKCGSLVGANFNTTADQPITITPGSATTYILQAINVTNPSVSMTTAVGGFYTAASKGGLAVVAASQVYSALTTNAHNTAGARFIPSVPANVLFDAPTIYLSLTTAQGATATADIDIFCQPMH